MSRHALMRLFILNGCCDAEIVLYMAADVGTVRKMRAEIRREVT